ncbi:glycosyl transferases group 1 family protein [Synechococcus sp. Minos11]|uniref:glycosyltransferase family 4 protein n=1 Tax=Synechococcus sp. Minos11 TaxID=221341 RepID=UPI001645F22D|nr:glycosyltransferase family 4 protein [Synechococcus sp. Minos11]QNJ07702.1 glycosyl transferases group 1 family protein [Synechococcus sp. Minos11]
MKVIFWQTIITPHIFYLAESLGSLNIDVTYVALNKSTPDRSVMGWNITPSSTSCVRFHLINSLESLNDFLASPISDAFHIFQGVRGDKFLSFCQSKVSNFGFKQIIMLESPNLNNILFSYLKSQIYKHIFSSTNDLITAYLAIGYRLPLWLAAHNVPPSKIYQFAYFLDSPSNNLDPSSPSSISHKKFRFLYVGSLLKDKGVLDLFKIFVSNKYLRLYSSLHFIGDGPLRKSLESHSHCLRSEISHEVVFHGNVHNSQIPHFMSHADCLVLPSRHDGWGAVVSEALLSGTPVIVSSSCGSAEVARLSRLSSVFNSRDWPSLLTLMLAHLFRGRISSHSREQLQSWARCLSADCGAVYLASILKHLQSSSIIQDRPAPPWQ